MEEVATPGAAVRDLTAGAVLLPVGGVFDLVAGALDRAVDRFAGPLEGAFAVAAGERGGQEQGNKRGSHGVSVAPKCVARVHVPCCIWSVAAAGQ